MSWADDVKAVHAQSGGLLTLHVFRPVDMPQLLLDAVAGDREAFMLADAVNDALTAIESAPRKRPMLCGCCPRSFPKNEFSIVIAIPEVGSPTRLLSVGICSRCATEPEQIRDKAVTALRKIFPDAKPVDLSVVQQGGHA